MRKKRFLRPFGLVVFALGAVCFFTGCSTPESPVAVYFNGNVYTADKENPAATAFAVKDGKFIYVGTDQGALKYGNGVNLRGKRVIPGIVDSHCHPVLVAALSSLHQITVPSNLNLEDTLAFLKEKAADAEHRDLPVILGFGFGINCRPNHAVDLDRAIPDRPAVIFSDDGHAVWINSKAIRLAKLDKETPDPRPGASYFERDAEGNPTGYVVETTAGFYLLRRLGIVTTDHIREGLSGVQSIFARNGVTTVFDAGFAVPEKTALQALRALEKRDELTMRYFTSYFYLGPPLDTPENMIETMKANRKKFTSPLIQADTLKMIGDGTVEVQTAWMFEDYLPPSKGRGAPNLRFDEMLPAGKNAAENGFNIHNHAIGDAAVSEALNLHQALGKIDGTKTICHIQVVPRDGVLRFTEQKDIFYQTTPCWLAADEFTEKVLGKERYLRQTPLASVIKGGVTVTFGSDFPASDGPTGVNAFLNMHYAVNRATDDSIAPPKSEGISVKECIDAYTINGAKQLGAADRIGSITSGKSADFVVCSDDILAIEPQKLKDVTVDSTYFRGKRVYSAGKK